jgi:hypothetical protein
VVVDIATLLIASGLRLAEQLVLSWVKSGKSEVKVSEVDSSIAKEAQREAERLRVRVDDLERETRRMFEQLVSSTPELSYAKPRLHSALTIDYDPRDPASSKELLARLHERVQELMPTDRTSPIEQVGAPPSDTPKVSVTVQEPHEIERSKQMLEDLKDRIQRRESERK